MIPNTVFNQFTHKPSFSKAEFRTVIHAYKPSYSDSSVTWLLGKLQKNQQIIRLGNGRYCMAQQAMGKQAYGYVPSPLFGNVVQTIVPTYPLADFQVWELSQLNEFMNHQIAKNTIIVEAEKTLLEGIFELLHGIYPYTLFCPSEEQYYRQRSSDTTIIVQKLTSEAPKPLQMHIASLEKILVDLLSNKLPGKLINAGEYRNILEGAFSKYLMKEKQLLRYARRRNVMPTLHKCLIECGIELEK